MGESYKPTFTTSILVAAPSVRHYTSPQTDILSAHIFREHLDVCAPTTRERQGSLGHDDHKERSFHAQTTSCRWLEDPDDRSGKGETAVADVGSRTWYPGLFMLVLAVSRLIQNCSG